MGRPICSYTLLKTKQNKMKQLLFIYSLIETSPQNKASYEAFLLKFHLLKRVRYINLR